MTTTRISPNVTSSSLATDHPALPPTTHASRTPQRGPAVVVENRSPDRRADAGCARFSSERARPPSRPPTATTPRCRLPQSAPRGPHAERSVRSALAAHERWRVARALESRATGLRCRRSQRRACERAQSQRDAARDRNQITRSPRPSIERSWAMMQARRSRPCWCLRPCTCSPSMSSAMPRWASPEVPPWQRKRRTRQRRAGIRFRRCNAHDRHRAVPSRRRSRCAARGRDRGAPSRGSIARRAMGA